MMMWMMSLYASAFCGTIALQGDFIPLVTDIVVLDSTVGDRLINYRLDPYMGDDFRFSVRLLNLDTLNWQFGDTVTQGSFELYGNEFNFGGASGITEAYFQGRDWLLPPEATAESLTIRIALGAGSDAVALYRPTLLVTDTITPGMVSDLTGTSMVNSIMLTWTAPGDDGPIRRAAAYEIRYSSLPVESDTVAWWQAAIPVRDSLSPSMPGLIDSLGIVGLDTNVTYYAILVTIDELGNRSGFSNVTSVTTTGPHGNYCLRYDGTQYAEAPFDTLLNTGTQLTIEAWFYLDGTYTWNHASIIDKRVPDHSPPFYQYNMGPANHMDFYAHVAINGEYDPFELYNVVQTDTWTHAAVTYDGINRFVYLNGAMIDSVYDPGQINNYSSSIRIGALGSFEDWFFKGLIDEIRIWSVARSLAEINQYMHHRLTGFEASLVACWSFDDGFGQVIADRSPNHIDGRLGYSDGPDERDPVWVPSTAPIDTLVVDGITDGSNELPGRVSVDPNYPNPFNSTTNIGFALPTSAHVELAIYDMLGRRVKTLADEPFEAGHHNLSWDGTSDTGQIASSGVYFYRMKTGDFEDAQKLVMLK
jgi:hypothetical protein